MTTNIRDLFKLLGSPQDIFTNDVRFFSRLEIDQIEAKTLELLKDYFHFNQDEIIHLEHLKHLAEVSATPNVMIKAERHDESGRTDKFTLKASKEEGSYYSEVGFEYWSSINNNTPRLFHNKGGAQRVINTVKRTLNHIPDMTRDKNLGFE